MVDFRAELSVGKPNSNVKTSGPGVRVIKRFASPGYTANKEGDTNDFAILVLEKDLMKIEPAQLMTIEIEKELVEKKEALINFFIFWGICKNSCFSRSYSGVYSRWVGLKNILKPFKPYILNT